MNEINDINSKIVTAYFYFTPQDIYNFRFNNIVYCEINGQAGYYRVNKIVNYDPTDIKSTKVELLKAIDVSGTMPDTDNPTTVVIKSPIEGVEFINGNLLPTGGKNDINGNGTVLTGINNSVGPKSLTIGNNNLSNGNSNSIFGSDNNINGTKNYISGDDNNTSGDKKMVVGDGNNDRSSSSLIFGSNNNVNEGSFKVNLFGDNNNIVSSTSSGVFSTSSVSGLVNNIFSFGDNNYFGPSSSGAYIIGSGMTANGPNELIFGNNFTSIIFPTGVTISGLTYEEVTITDLNTVLIPGNLLKPGALYKIDTQQTSWKDNGIFLQAISTNQLNKVGARLFLAPRTYQTTTDGFGNNWLGVWRSTLTPAIGDLVIWGGRVWSNVTGSVGSFLDPFTTLDGDWYVIDKDTFSNGEYIEMIMACQFDYANNWVEKQLDDNGNIVGIGPAEVAYEGQILYNPCDYSDWNQNTKNPVFRNNLPMGFFNNIVSTLYGNVCKRIWNNLTNLHISENLLIEGEIYFNTNNGFIWRNKVGKDIFSNSNNGSIDNNHTTGHINFNINTGNITSNSNNGNISLNSNGDDIYSNSNNGHIDQNYNNGVIDNNSNNGDIYSNTNNGPIS